MSSLSDLIAFEREEGDRFLAVAKSIVGVRVRSVDELRSMGDRSLNSLRKTLRGKAHFHANAAESTLTQAQRYTLWAYERRVEEEARRRENAPTSRRRTRPDKFTRRPGVKR